MAKELGEGLAAFADRHLRRLCCLEVVLCAGRLLLARSTARLTAARLAADYGLPTSQAQRALEMLAQTGLLIRARGPCYILSRDPETRALLSALVAKVESERSARQTVLSFVLMREVCALEEELATTRAVQQAKRLLMRECGFTEEEAHEFLMKRSRDSGRTLRSVSEDFLGQSKPSQGSSAE